MRYSFALLALLLTACSGGAEPAYYALNLPTAKSVTAAQQTAGERLVVTRVTLPEYLNDMGIAYQQDDVQVVTANQARWAEALDKQLTQALVLGLSGRLSGVQVIDGADGRPDIWRLSVEVSGFQGRFDGKAVVAGRWVLQRGDQIHSQPFLRLIPLAEDGYPALVRALRDGWQQEIDELAGILTAKLTPAGYGGK